MRIMGAKRAADRDLELNSEGAIDADQIVLDGHVVRGTWRAV